jgi:hypothetical protein
MRSGIEIGWVSNNGYSNEKMYSGLVLASLNGNSNNLIKILWNQPTWVLLLQGDRSYHKQRRFSLV